MKGLVSTIAIRPQAGIKLCDATPDRILVKESPSCPACGLALGVEPPIQETELLLQDLNEALGQQNQRLSHVLVQRIIHGQVDTRLEKFLKIVQASDLSALANTLDDELLTFIRRLLG